MDSISEKKQKIDQIHELDYRIDRNLLFENRIKLEWLTTKEAAHFLKVSENALRIMVHRGQIEVYKFGRRLRFKFSDCASLFEKKGA